MRMFICCTALIGFVFASCAQSAHQRQRMNLENPLDDGTSQSLQALMTPIGIPSLYSQLKTAPSTYIGRTVTLSGIVLKAKRLQGSTEVEILQLPEAADGRPMQDRRHSQGRFLAIQTTTFLDPAILSTGPMVTVVGSVEETVERPLETGADPYSYPVIAVQQLIVWPSELLASTAPFYPITAGAASLSPTSTNSSFALDLVGSVLSSIFQNLLNSDGSGRRSSYSSLSSSPGASSSNPSPPPPKDIPPQFRKPN